MPPAHLDLAGTQGRSHISPPPCLSREKSAQQTCTRNPEVKGAGRATRRTPRVREGRVRGTTCAGLAGLNGCGVNGCGVGRARCEQVRDGVRRAYGAERPLGLTRAEPDVRGGVRDPVHMRPNLPPTSSSSCTPSMPHPGTGFDVPGVNGCGVAFDVSGAGCGWWGSHHTRGSKRTGLNVRLDACRVRDGAERARG